MKKIGFSTLCLVLFLAVEAYHVEPPRPDFEELFPRAEYIPGEELFMRDRDGNIIHFHEVEDEFYGKVPPDRIKFY